MRKLNILQVIILLSLFSVFLHVNHLPSPKGLQVRTPGGNLDNEDSLRKMREKYWELVHKAAPGVIWQQIEEENMRKNRIMQDQRRLLYNNARVQTEIFANGKIQATWYERGSKNLSGRFLEMEYDNDSKFLYGISASGDFWKVLPGTSSWQVLNDRFLLDGTALVMYKPTSTSRRFIACHYSGAFYETRKLFYSNDDGVTWIPAIYNTQPYGLMDKLIKVDNAQQTIFHTTGWGGASNQIGPALIYMSNNGGLNYTRLVLPTEFITGQTYCALAKAPGDPEVYLFNANKVLYTIDANGAFTKKGSITGLPVSTQVQPNAFLSRGYEYRISRGNGGLVFYAMIDHKNLFKSTDGLSWQFVSSTPTNSGGYAVFNVAPNNTNWLSYGDIELYYSINGGTNWTKTNGWGEYYNNPNKLHADIQSYKYFQEANGQWIQFSSNDAGVYKSTDNFITNTNIGLQNLNISQYYDVATDPIDASFIWGGSQDQGIQRATNGINITPIDFLQYISGDYSSTDFTSDASGLLTQYPGGGMLYANNPRGAVSLGAFYQIEGPDKGNYGWHIPVSVIANAPDKAFWVGGGNMNNTGGSFLIRLARNTANNGFVYTQRNYNFRQNSNSTTSNISAMEVSPADTSRIYVACEDGSFFYTSDAGINWNKTASYSGPNPPFITPSSILVSKKNKDLVCFGGSGYSNEPFYISSDGGKTFTQAKTGLPSTTIFDLTYNDNESLIFAATQAGPYVYIVADNQWYSLLGAFSPLSCNYTCVEYVASQNIVRFGTYGRGIWDFKLANASINSNLNVNSTCVGNGFIINYSSYNSTFNSGNIFTAQLSNATGSFSSPVNIGTTSSTSASGTINVTVPSNTTSGNNYLIRIISSNPVLTGNESNSFIINTIPSSSTITAGGVTTFCQSGNVTLTSNTASGNQWYKDGVAISGSTGTTLNATGNGSYTVKVTSGGCESASSNAISVVVNSIPAAPAITTGSATTFCGGGNVTLTSNATSGNQWYKDGISINGSTAITLNVIAGGNYTTKVTFNGCESAISNAIAVTVNSIPPTPSISQNGFQVTSSVASGNQWYLNGVVVTGANGQNYTPLTIGNYTVQVSANNCTSAFSNGINVTVTGIPNIDVFSNQIKVLPNPVRNKLIINRSGLLLPLNISLFDINGKKLKQINSNVSSTEINMANYAAGTYIIWIEDSRNKIRGKKIIIKQ